RLVFESQRLAYIAQPARSLAQGKIGVFQLLVGAFGGLQRLLAVSYRQLDGIFGLLHVAIGVILVGNFHFAAGNIGAVFCLIIAVGVGAGNQLFDGLLVPR